ncbi:hypothetical protein EVG20_g440 [Dentipellis fragilis]|uniref:AB hydrolase-1 domain-containing protein n=1 Tax=Dentipellis fragilis TaxID=205917 RepID=A0A4Y9ZDP8_9AGAM|nr:hypothetical protein EVG20_g440 [Dentipellis fragilis]
MGCYPARIWARAGSLDYTTVVLIHGFAWHGGIFQHMSPFAEQYNARLIFVNRRDYPDSDPYDTDDHKLLVPSGEDTARNIRTFMDQRAVELVDFLELLVEDLKLPRAKGSSGGIVLVGWSCSGVFITAVLAYLQTMPHKCHSLRKYLRRAVLYDVPYHVLGYSPPSVSYHPMTDPKLSAPERLQAFAAWVSGYFNHGRAGTSLELKQPLLDPQPTILSMSDVEQQSCLHLGPGAPGGSDLMLMTEGARHGVFALLKADALYLKPGIVDETPVDDAKLKPNDDLVEKELEVVYLWCDQSVWEMPWGARALQSELGEARKLRKPTRSIKIKQMRWANHFAHWDQPERVLRALLTDSDLV